MNTYFARQVKRKYLQRKEAQWSVNYLTDTVTMAEYFKENVSFGHLLQQSSWP